MKTYEQLLDEVVTSEYHRINPVAVNIHKNVAKRYAMQWVERASEVALMDEEMRSFDGVIVKAENHREYKFNSERFKYILTVDKDSILNLKKEIDAQ